MDKRSVKGFILLDVLCGLSLMIAVVLLCLYFQQFATGMAVSSAQYRDYAITYYNQRNETAPLLLTLDVELVFCSEFEEQKTITQKQLLVVDHPLYKRIPLALRLSDED